jgi:uncharacterized surface protein with fasciclin (FAS1) repeats
MLMTTLSRFSALVALVAMLFAAPDALAQYGEKADAPSLVEVVVSTDALSTLETAVKEAGLVEALSGEGPFTVFAPTDDAFGALPEGTVASLLEDENIETLKGILTYHVVPGKLKAADLSDGQVLETLNGKALRVSIADGTVMVGGATVVTPNVAASNGVAHVIDGVLIPPTDESMSSSY